jgi:hypothetical protein
LPDGKLLDIGDCFAGIPDPKNWRSPIGNPTFAHFILKLDHFGCERICKNLIIRGVAALKKNTLKADDRELRPMTCLDIAYL